MNYACLFATLAILPAAAHAQPAPEATASTEEPRRRGEPVRPAQVPVEQPLTAADVRDAPRPGFEHGRVDPIDTGDSTARQIGRAMLWIPRVPYELVAQPVRGATYVQDRYQVIDRLTRLFFTEDERLGIFPTALFETGFGWNVGARALLRDMFGKRERIQARAGLGGQLKRVVEIDADTGTAIHSRVRAGIGAAYESRDEERFFGFGNADEVDAVGSPLDPLAADLAVSTRYHVKIWRVAPQLRVQLPSDFWFTVTGAAVSKEFGTTDQLDDDDVPIEDGFMTARLPGFVEGTDFWYGEVEAAWDTMRKAHPYDAAGIRGTGTLALVYAGRQDEIGGGPGFFRLGVDLQHHVALTTGPRMLTFRLTGEAVTGDLDDVPFTELPSLGGNQLLRGYDTDRFRDRVAAVAQGSYLWALGHNVATRLFVDVGRVYSGLDDLTLDDLRVGFGGAIEGYTETGLVVRLELATSIDGDIFAYVALNPFEDARSRVDR